MIKIIRIPLFLLLIIFLYACDKSANVDLSKLNGTCANEGCHSKIETISETHGCVSCHGGNAEESSKEGSHPQYTPTLNTWFAPELPMRNKGWNWTNKLDESIRINGEAEIRFLNPGDLRVADVGCGNSNPDNERLGCHGEIIERVKLNIHSMMQGDLSQILYLNGDPIQPDNASRWGGYDVKNPNFNSTAEGSVPEIRKLPPIECLKRDHQYVVSGDIKTEPCPDHLPNCCPDDFVYIGYPQPDFMSEGEIVSRMYDNNDCARCHLWNPGSMRTGDMRSTGCTACHMKYENDGLSRSFDESIDRTRLGRVSVHTFKQAMDDDQCAHCHNRGGRIPQAYYGRREKASGGRKSPKNPKNAKFTDISVLGEGPYDNLHGRKFPYYVDDEDTTNDYDETPPDVHTKYGMGCIDCHIETEVHGDGNIYADRFYEVEIKCQTCHGDPNKVADGITIKGRKHPRLFVESNWLYGDKIFLELKSTGKRIEVTQIKNVIDSGENPRAKDGCLGANGKHLEKLECYTCHATWYPNCFHCHVDRNDSDPERNWTDGMTRVGKLTKDNRLYVSVDTFVLGVNRNDEYKPEGKYASFVAFGTFNTYDDGVKQVFKDRVPRAMDGKSLGIPWNKLHSHTNQTIPRNCDECHRDSTKDMPEDKTILVDVGCNDRTDETYKAQCREYDRIRVTYGYGSDRFPFTAFIKRPEEVTPPGEVPNTEDVQVNYVLDRFVGEDRYRINCPDPNAPIDPTDPTSGKFFEEKCLGPNPVSHNGFRALKETEVLRMFSVEATPQERTDPKFPNKPQLGVLK